MNGFLSLYEAHQRSFARRTEPLAAAQFLKNERQTGGKKKVISQWLWIELEEEEEET